VATPPVVSAVDAESVPAPEGIEKLITSPTAAASPLAQVTVAMIVLVLDPSAGRLSGVALTTIELTDPVGVADVPVPVPVPPSPPVLQPVNITREIHKTRTNKNLNKLLFISLLPCQRMKKNRCIPVLNSLFAHPHAPCTMPANSAASQQGDLFLGKPSATENCFGHTSITIKEKPLFCSFWFRH
jgi:hypothetical protein